jgi:hypothetical protein
VQLPGDGCDHYLPFCSHRRERGEEQGVRRRRGEREGSARAEHATASECDADGSAEFQSGEERDLRSLKKMLLGAMTAMVLAAAVAVSPASAATPLPTGVQPSEGRYTQDANVPYLAWQGEHVRLVACKKGAPFAPTYTASWMLVDPLNWPDFEPAADPLSVKIVGGCAIATWISDKPGVAFIKVIVHNADGPVYEKVFIVGWMELMKPIVKGGGDVYAGDFCQYATVDPVSVEAVRLTGPVSNCGHDPQDPRHRIQIIVKGKLPLEADFSRWGLGESLTMPDDWAKWAAVAARTTTQSDPLKAMSNWDIHDDSLLTEGHTIWPGQCADQEIYVNFDAVDTCNSEGPRGGFSTVLGPQATDGLTIGPFDPIYSIDTMLSDGKLDPGDAPMPAAQIDVSIKDNVATDPTDIGGVGYLFPSWKAEVYSRDGLGSDPWGNLPTPVAHNYFAPFYSQYIPATARPVNAAGSPYGPAAPPSGIEGTNGTGGFSGFLWNSVTQGPYDNWEFAWEYSRKANAASHCLFSQILPGLRDYYRPLPSGVNAVSVYTDESGEANVNFVPGLGMYFDNLAAANKNLNNGCDLENVNPIGTAEVDIVARYPYQPVTAPAVAADPVKFNVLNKFKKSLTVYSKGVDKNGIVSNSVAKIVLAHAQDIDGSPLAYELVCWMADSNAAGMRIFAGDLPDPNKPDAVINIDPIHALFSYQDPWGLNRLCTFTDRWGNTAIEVYNSNKTPVDVIAEFVFEGLLRDTIADFSKASIGATTSADGPPTSHVPSQQQLNQAIAVGASGPVVATKSAIKTIKSKQAKNVKKVLHKIRFAKVVTPFHGKAKLLVRVNGKAGMVGLRITIMKNGKARVVTRFIPANRKIAVKNLVIPAKTAKVTVKLIGI